MLFEEALQALRQGKKIRHPHFKDDVYLMGCYISILGDPEDNFEKAKERGMSIVKMKGDRQADEMSGMSSYVAKIKRQLKQILTEEDYKKYHNFYTEMEISKIFDNDIFVYPQLNLLLVMSDDWEIME